MLSEYECRVLQSGCDILLEDFDPRDATLYLESNGLLSQDDAEIIEHKPTRLERLTHFLRIYRRKAEDLSPLIAYFEYSNQTHISDFLRDRSESNFDSEDVFSSTNLNNKLSLQKRKQRLLAGQVPMMRNHVIRKELSDEVINTVKDLSELDSFFVVLHGTAGVGKSSLASSVLSTDEELIGCHFDNVCYLRDSRTTAEDVKYLFNDLLVMLQEDAISNKHYVNDLSTVALTKLIRDALVDKPNVLVVLDDVMCVDTVRWADQLRLRVLATTRNREIFNAATSKVSIIEVDGFTEDETEEFLTDKLLLTSQQKSSDFVTDTHSTCSGNPALLGKLVRLSDGKFNKFSNLVERVRRNGLGCVSCITSYDHDNLQETLSESVMQLTDTDRNALATAVVMPVGVWIPVAVWALVVPVDVSCNSDGTEEVYEQLSRLVKLGGFLISNDLDSFMVSSFISIYLKETVDIDSIRSLSRSLSTALQSIQSSGDNQDDDVTQFLADNSLWVAFSKEMYLH